ncbi:MAG: hypothetical protein KC543_01415 [Myxococcales bacterium]|nr:hypothetical protein [Myxococcales bacterium]
MRGRRWTLASLGRRSRRAWPLVLVVAVVEVGAAAWQAARVPAAADWERAASWVRSEHRAGDAIVAAPAWTDPLVRERLGDLIPISVAGMSDADGVARWWEVSIRGAADYRSPRTPPEAERRFGRVRVRRWTLAPNVVYDLTANIADARALLRTRGTEQPCRWVTGVRPMGGGLGRGPMAPPSRFACPALGSGAWIGRTVIEDLALEPRTCVLQRPSARGAVRVVYDDVPLGERLVVYAGLYSEDERMRDGAPVHVVVRVDGRVRADLVHRDGDGWARWVVPTDDGPSGATTEAHGRRGQIAIDVLSPNPERRSLCWAATVRSGPPREPPPPEPQGSEVRR